jgi:hypothetical protein
MPNKPTEAEFLTATAMAAFYDGLASYTVKKKDVLTKQIACDTLLRSVQGYKGTRVLGLVVLGGCTCKWIVSKTTK